ncbi:alkylated DNA repair protein alkB 8 isoform X1 [Tripterygium wilfordii]|uniref:Alkylated DNA repair protein alkB 8 isoform X1 n=1 Tax=Tripterygium wilfordii TaxID=458696 RepID=A0A7J7CFL5_TRIWF|nr:alkylated DNA repair protein alkB homolog 8 [Tripterygium wilfordii]KAF5732667.1 alkylated DNA repair protein alkB 8 isoform X1 [Tripterygium wilfordii]
MEDQTTALREVFGESSSESEDNEQQIVADTADYGDVESPSTVCDHNLRWEGIEGVNGLWLCRDFLSPHQQSTLLSAIQAEGWFNEAPHNQAMRFGDLPAWATEICSSIREVVLFGDHISQPMDLSNFDGDKEANVLASNLLWREPLFDQLIVNVYQAGEGICAHTDLMRFEDGIAIVSLESSCVMHFSRAGEECDGQGKEKENHKEKVPVFLTPGSLVLMSGEARYLWKHEINRKPGFQVCEGQELIQKRRTSITFRKLCQVE